MPVAVYASLAMLGVGCLALRPAFRRPASERQRETPRRQSQPAEPPVLGARALSKSYRTPSGETVEVLQGVDLEIPAHGLTALIGPSGTGKSTLLNLFGGLDTPDRGQVLFRGEPLPARECDALRCYRAQCVSFVFQELNLIKYDAATCEFKSSSAVAAQDGHVRCTLIADGFQAAPALVEWLRQRGFRTVDQLAAHDGLLRLARVLALLVGLAVLGCVLNGAITVLISTLMSVRSKTFEIGILRAHGFRDGEVMAIFLCQAIILGALALGLAVAVVLLAEPLVRELVCGAMGIRGSAFVAASPLSKTVWWLFSVAAAIAVAFSVVGVTIPAAWACRLSPVEALRRRE